MLRESGGFFTAKDAKFPWEDYLGGLDNLGGTCIWGLISVEKAWAGHFCS